MEDNSLEKFEFLLSKEPTNSQLEDMYVWLVFQCLNEHFPENSNFTHIKNVMKGSVLEWWKINHNYRSEYSAKDFSHRLYWNYQNLNLEDFYHINAYNKIKPVSSVAWTIFTLSDMSNALENLFKNDERVRLISLIRNLSTIASSSALWGYSFDEKHQYMIDLAQPKENHRHSSEWEEKWKQQRCKDEAEYEATQRDFRESQKKAEHSNYLRNYQKGQDNIAKNGVSKSGMRY